MNAVNDTSPATRFWIVGSLALVWNLLGLMAWIMQLMVNEEAMAAMSEAERVLYETMPMWVNIAFAVAVIGGTLGCVGLLMRKSWALGMFVVSLLGILAQDVHTFALSDALAVYGQTVLIMPSLVMLIAVFLIWYANSARGKGWIT